MAQLQASPWSDWEAVRLIGRGSFGTVYEIQRKLVDEDTEAAALKVITIPQNPSDIEEMYSEGYDDESITATFNSHLKSIVAEYSLMRKMDGSANIVNCKDIRYIQHESGLGWDIYIRMELLTPLMKALPIDTDEATVIRIGRDMCNALVLCNKHEIIHRDIKPQNIFISPNGDYKLGDFGIAKTVERTIGGTKIGTYKYMAPEVYNNQPYGSSADIYSLGLVLYWLLNERRMPFMPLPPAKLNAGQDEEARYRRLSGEKLPEPAHGSDALKQIVLKACAYNPKDRYASAAAMLYDLTNLMGGVEAAAAAKAAKAAEAAEAARIAEAERAAKAAEAARIAEAERAAKAAEAARIAEAERAAKAAEAARIAEAERAAKAAEAARIAEAERATKAAEAARIAEAERAAKAAEAARIAEAERAAKAAEAARIAEAERAAKAAKAAEAARIAEAERAAKAAEAARIAEAKEAAKAAKAAAAAEAARAKEAAKAAKAAEAAEAARAKEAAKAAKAAEAAKAKEAAKAAKAAKASKNYALRYTLIGVGIIGVALLFTLLKSCDSNKKPSANATVGTPEQSVWSDWVDELPGRITAEKYDIEEKTLYSSRVLETTTSTEQDTMDGWELFDTVEANGEFGEWSDWSSTEAVASETREVETQTKYRYRDKETTTSSSSSKDGWTKYNTTNSWGSYGSWSSWSSDKATKSDSRDVETKTQYRYRDKQTTSSYESSMSGWTQYDVQPSYTSYGEWSDWRSTYIQETDTCDVDRREVIGEDGQPRTEYRFRTRNKTTVYYYQRVTEWSNYSDNYVASSGTREVSTRTLYRYRDRKSTPVYHFYRWGSWSDWSEEQVSETDKREVESTNFYRYRDKVETTTYHFRRWTDWSDYSETPVTASETQEVQTKTQYRYKKK